MPRAKASLLALLTAALAAALLLLAPYTPAVPVQTMRVAPGQWVRSVEMGGAVRRGTEPCISLQGGVIRRIHARCGEWVKKGQLLFSMDTSAQEKALEMLMRMRHSLKNIHPDAVALAYAQDMEWM